MDPEPYKAYTHWASICLRLNIKFYLSPSKRLLMVYNRKRQFQILGGWSDFRYAKEGVLLPCLNF